jgi:methionine sulfoxide reductase catalytic subunit
MAKRNYRSIRLRSSEITPEEVYLNRREFMKQAGVLGAGTLLLAACGPTEAPAAVPTGAPTAGQIAEGSEETAVVESAPAVETGPPVDELGFPATDIEAVTNFNNFYEFTTNKERVAKLATDFQTSRWTVEVGGLVQKPKTYGVEDLTSLYDQEERVYRMRCVEGWSMVIPWMGFSLGALLKDVEPMASAKYVRFQTLADENQMPGLSARSFPWPYEEGLRLDEAYNDLAILSTGLYGKPLLPQNGAPLRMVVPWKYGFKSIKSIIKIELVEQLPPTFWALSAPSEYGFYSNVNPGVPHPRWSQATERRIGESGRRETLMFNGYSDEVASMYADMDLSIFY